MFRKSHSSLAAVMAGFLAVAAISPAAQALCKGCPPTVKLPDLIPVTAVIAVDADNPSSASVNVTVKNVGQANAGSSCVRVRIYLGGATTPVTSALLPIPGLAPGTSALVIVPRSCSTSGTYRVEVVADATLQVTESNENNNAATYWLYR